MSDERVEGTASVCPSCGARVRADVPWCTQCYSSLRPPEGSVEGPSDAGPSTGPTDRAEVERVAEQLLAQLATSHSEVKGLAARLPSSPGARLVLVVVVVVVVTALLVLLMFLLGSAL